MPLDSHDHLDSRHIRMIQLDRQALYRARTYRLIFGLGALGVSVQLAFLSMRQFTWQHTVIGILEIAAAIMLAGISFWMLRSAHKIMNHAAISHITKSTEVPDFSTLSNGSQFADRLSSMTGNSQLEIDIVLDDSILNHALDLAMEWGEDFMKPTQERLRLVYPDMAEKDLDLYDQLAQSAMKYGHSIAGGDFETFKQSVHLRYPWVNNDNLHRLFNQGMYFANK